MEIVSVYNTCGINQDKTDWYSQCLESVLEQDMKTEVVVSSCMNSVACLRTLKERFGDQISIVFYPDRLIVNSTFNKTVRVKDKGQDGFLFLDSGVKLTDKTSISQMAERLDKSSMVALQVDVDTGFGPLGMLQDSSKPQVVGEDFKIPLGKGINLHAQIFGRELQDTFGNLIPDVFAAYCTESTFSFLNACVQKDWVIVADVMAHHNKAVDGPSSSQPHHSPVHRNPWNNLLHGRDALDFINDPEAKQAGLGYEECGRIMMHDPSAYDGDIPKDPEKLIEMVKKYFFLNPGELDYEKIDYLIVGEN